MMLLPAWAIGKFIYRNTPIDEVLKELSFYYGTQLYASEHERTITGEFKTDDLGEIIALIEKTLDIRIIQKER
jgi:transmembrane sensor